MTVRRFVLPLVLAGAGAAPFAQAQDITFSGSVGLAHRKLTETTASGATLLTERGPMLQLQLRADRPLASGGALAARLMAAGGDLDYDGQTQSGAPLTTTTRQSELGADLLWRPHAPAAWGEGWLSLGWLGNRRAIQSTPAASGLDERSLAWMAGVQWRSPAFAPAGRWTARVEAEARVSVQHRLHVDYLGLLDPSSLHGGRKRQLALRLVAAPDETSPWSWTLEWARLTQGVSETVPVYRNGVLFGSVRQPKLAIDDVALRVTRRF
jgi:hypothetical protein